MHTKEPREDPLVEMGYEVRDIDYPKVRTVAIIFFGFTAFCAILGWFMYIYRFKFFAVTPPGEVLKRQLPASQFPLLQDNVTSKVDISVLRERETARMASTGYNPDGSVHIPVDRAMALLAQRGLPPTHHSVPAVNSANITGPNIVGTPPPVQFGTPNPPLPGEAPPPPANEGASNAAPTGGG